MKRSVLRHKQNAAQASVEIELDKAD